MTHVKIKRNGIVYFILNDVYAHEVATSDIGVTEVKLMAYSDYVVDASHNILLKSRADVETIVDRWMNNS